MRLIGVILVFALGCQLHAQEVDIRLYQKVPMRDGINLSANLFLPEERSEGLPTILIYTPYVNDEAIERGMFFAKKGYVFMSLDLRGRGNSEGVYAPFEKDGQDGYDAIEWIAKQPWSNGEVGMMGGSYRGMVQWLTLKEKPSALKTMVPTASVGPGLDFPKSNGMFYNYALQWLTFTSGRSRNDNMFGNGGYWQSKAMKKFNQQLAFKDWDMITLGERNPVFQKWLAHPDFDSYWQDIYPSSSDYAQFDLPILTITGYYDGDQPGAMAYYERHMRHATEAAKDQHYYIIGPWSHAGTRNPVTELGGMKFGEDSKLNMLELHLEWFDWTLKGKEKPEFLKDRVAYYLSQQNDWNYANDYYSISVDSLQFYLSSPETDASHFMKAGLLQKEIPGKEEPDVHVYDPGDTTVYPAYTGSDFYLDPSPGYGQHQLVYISDPLENDVALFGQARLSAFIEMDVVDSDFSVALYEKTALGETIFLTSDGLRARYRNSLEKAELVKPGAVERYEFDDFAIQGIKIKKGSRIMLVFSSANNPFTQKNYNSGKDVSLETGADTKVANIKLHHSKRFPSLLKIPYVSK